MSSLAFTTQIGCKVNCIRYCPQELVVAKHKGMKPLTLEAFKQLITTVPPDITLHFAGFSEPFLNPECIDMIEWAHKKGHEIKIYSTLVGMTPEVAERVTHIPITHFELHLPDTHDAAHIEITEEYLKCLGIILGGIHNLKFMNMGYEFVTNGSDLTARGMIARRKGRVYCANMESPCYDMLPDGGVYFCCITRGLEMKIGSLYESTYQELIANFPEESVRLQKDVQSLCHVCCFAYPYWMHQVFKMKDKYLGSRPLGELLISYSSKSKEE